MILKENKKTFTKKIREFVDLTPPKEISSHVFKIVLIYKIILSFHETHNQVKINTGKKIKLFPELFINEIFKYTFV